MDKARAKRMAAELLNQAIGDWVLSEYRGESGRSALVFRARRGEEVAAVKVFDPELIERFGKVVQQERIQRELRLRGRSHPNLVKILDGGHCAKSDLWYVVMEYLDAPNLATVLQEVQRERIWPLISQIADAARFLEELELAHRDIKPENIVVFQGFERAVLLDLGVIRPFGAEGVTDEERLLFVGTLQYSPPEMLFRIEEDNREGWRAVTFYQLGAVLHDLISKKRLFQDFADPYPRLVEAIKYEIPKIEAPDVSPDLVLLARNCLSKKPDLRLRLVHWTDFSPREGPAGSVSDAKERIRRRRGHAQETKTTPEEVEAEQRALGIRRSVEMIQGRLQEMIRQECVGSDLFPPMEIHDSQDDNPGGSRFLVYFRASRDHGVQNPVSVWVEISLLDQQSAAVQIQCVAGVSAVPLGRDRAEEHQAACIFEGVFEEAAIKSVIQELLYPLLDRAQEIEKPGGEEKGGAGVQWLEIPNKRADNDVR